MLDCQRQVMKQKVIVKKTIEIIKKEFQCKSNPWHKWFAFYINEPTQRRTLFSVVMVGRNTATICFRRPRYLYS